MKASPERGGTGPSARAGWRLLGSWRVLLLSGFGCLLNSVIVLLFAFASLTVDVLALLATALAGFLIGGAARFTEQAAGAATTARAAEADRMRTALLRAVSHDLRSPLAAAAAAVSSLRSADLQLTAADRDELLATAGESLDLLSRLAASLLDVTRLQAGSRSVFPRPAYLEEIITGALAGLAPQARSVRAVLPPGLPEVLADPPIAERVIANLAANALRYSPAGSAPLLTARASRDRIELRVADHGPGVPAADRNQMFVPFARLASRFPATGSQCGSTAS